MDDFKRYVSAYSEPMLLIEGMAQGVSDTYESEGIWYCAGYAVGTYAGTKGIAEVGKEVKGKVGVKGKVESGSETTLQTGGRQIEYNAYIKKLETIDTEYENIRIDTTDISKIAKNTGMPEWKITRVKSIVER